MADALDRPAGEAAPKARLVEPGEFGERRAERGRRARRAWLRAPRARTCSTGRPPGNRRSRRCGCRSRDAIRARSSPCARWSDRRRSGARRADRALRKARVGQTSRQARQAPQWSLSGASGGSARSVKIAPRNSQEPNSRLTRLVCLPCQPRPAAVGERLLHHRRGVDEDLDFSLLGARARDEPGRERLQPALDHVVIVAMARIDRDRAAAPVARARRADRRPVRSSSPSMTTLRASRPQRPSDRRGARRSRPSSPCRRARRRRATRRGFRARSVAGVGAATRQASKPSSRALALEIAQKSRSA